MTYQPEAQKKYRNKPEVKKKRKNHFKSLIDKGYYKEKNKKYYEEKKEISVRHGICVLCRRRKMQEPYLYCKECRELNKTRIKNSRMKKYGKNKKI